MAHDGEYSVSGPAAFSLRNAFGPGHDSGEGKQPGKHHAPVLRLSDGHHHFRCAAPDENRDGLVLSPEGNHGTGRPKRSGRRVGEPEGADLHPGGGISVPWIKGSRAGP